MLSGIVLSHRRRRSRRREREGRLQSPKFSYARPRCPPYATRRGGMVSVFMAWCGVVNGRCSPTVREDPSTKPEMGQAGGWENALGHILLHLEHLIIAGAELHLLGGHVERRWRGAAKVPSFRFVSKTNRQAESADKSGSVVGQPLTTPHAAFTMFTPAPRYVVCFPRTNQNRPFQKRRANGLLCAWPVLAAPHAALAARRNCSRTEQHFLTVPLLRAATFQTLSSVHGRLNRSLARSHNGRATRFTTDAD